LRLVLVAAAAWVWLDAAVAVLIGGFANAIRWLKIRSWTRDNVDLAAPSDPSMAAEMRRAMWRQWVNEIYYVTQGHISLYLLSIFGSVTNVADFGALGRIGIVFTGPIAAMQNIAMPRFARCQDMARLRRLYIEIFTANGVIAAALVAIAFAAPRPILWLLGAKYSGLDYEFHLYAVSLAIGMLSDTANGLNVVRSWIIPSWILVPTWVATQVLLMAAIGVSSLAQVLWISILTNTVLTCVYLSGAAHFARAFARATSSVRVS
jgi:O-antigen/teichoic acid export membrane protein